MHSEKGKVGGKVKTGQMLILEDNPGLDFLQLTAQLVIDMTWNLT